MQNRHTDRRCSGRCWAKVLLGVVVVLASLLVGASAVSAHTGFDSSTPADQAVVDQPVDVVTIAFTGPATPVGDGFVALNADGVIQQPVEVTTPDDQLFTIRFDPPLAGGAIGVRWSVQAADSHPIEGAFSFTVTAAAPTTTAPTTTVAATTAPTTTVGAGTTPAATATTPAAETAQPPASAAPSSSTTAVVADDGGSGSVGGDGNGESAAVSLDEFLEVDNSRPGETTALVGRILGLVGVALALGALAFALTSLRGLRVEVRRLLAGAAVLAAVLAIGAFIEYIGVARIGNESFGSAWTTSPGLATWLRILGGLALIVGLVTTLRRDEIGSVDRDTPPRALSAAVVDELDTSDQANAAPARVRWIPTARAWPIALGVVASLASFWFDGHTVSRGFRPLLAVVNTVHVAAGSIWVGGVVALCAIAWSRHRRGRVTGIAELVVRFSRVASIALGAVVVAGAAMALMVLDSFGALTDTEWGQTFLLKTGAVAIAIALGAYNHFALVPALDAEPDAPELRSRLRSTVTAEAIILVFVVVVTAWLVAAAT